MKKIFFLLVVMLAQVFQPFNQTTFAQNQNISSEYLRVTSEDVPFFSDYDRQNFVFYLPYSYYVKVIEEFAEVVHVECFGFENTPRIDGFVPKDALTSSSANVVNPFINYTVITHSTTILYSDISCQTPIRFVFPQRELGYYGQAKTQGNEYVYFVCYLGYSGYVKESGIKPFTLPLHPDPIEIEEPPTTQTEEEKPKTTDYSTLKLAIILCLLLAGVIALFTVLKKSSKQKPSSPYYEEEYE